MANGVWQATITSAIDGLPIPGATISVKLAGTSTDADLLQNRAGSVSKSNPFTANAEGFARFYCEPGRYDIYASSDGQDAEWVDVVIIEGLGGGGTAAGGNLLPTYLESDFTLSNLIFTGNAGLQAITTGGGEIVFETRTPGDFTPGDILAFDIVNIDEVEDNFSIIFVRMGQFETINIAQSGDAVTTQFAKMTLFMEVPFELDPEEPFTLVFFQNYNSFKFIVTAIYKI